MKRIIVVIAVVIAAFGLRSNGETQPTIPTTTTTTTVVEVQVLKAHDALQEDLNDPSAFGG